MSKSAKAADVKDYEPDCKNDKGFKNEAAGKLCECYAKKLYGTAAALSHSARGRSTTSHARHAAHARGARRTRHILRALRTSRRTGKTVTALVVSADGGTEEGTKDELAAAVRQMQPSVATALATGLALAAVAAVVP